MTIPAAETKKKLEQFNQADFCDELGKLAQMALEDQAIGPRLTNVEEEIVIATITKIKKICLEEAKNGKHKAEVFNLQYGESDKNHLSPVSLWIYRWCDENSLNPVIKQWQDGVGMNSGYRLQVSWHKPTVNHL